VLSKKSPAAKPILLQGTNAQAVAEDAAKGKGGAGWKQPTLESSNSANIMEEETPNQVEPSKEMIKEGAKCKPKTMQIPRYEVTSSLISQHIQYMCKIMQLYAIS